MKCSTSLLPLTKEEVNVFAHVCLSVCQQDYSKTRAWIWMKCCVSTDVGTWTNWLIFEPDPDHSPDAGTRLLSPISYKCCYFGKIPHIRIGGPPLQWRVVLKWFYSLSRWNTFVGGICALPSAVLVTHFSPVILLRSPGKSKLYCVSGWNWSSWLLCEHPLVGPGSLE